MRVGRMQLLRREIKGKIESGEHAVASHKIPRASNQHGCTDTAVHVLGFTVSANLARRYKALTPEP